MKKRYFIICFLLFAMFVNYIYGEVGNIIFIDGMVEITRDGEIFDNMDIDIGSEIENYDQIRTGPDGEIWIKITSKKSPKTELCIASNTTFYIELNTLNGKNNTILGMITGSLTCNVQKLFGDKKFEVLTDTTTMGVRGTEFTIQSSPAGDILVTCDTGSVACYDKEDEQEFYAEPGQVVEKRPGELFRVVPVAVSSLKSFRQKWIAERISAFKSNALRAIKTYALKYNDLYERFNKEYKALIGKSVIINKWYSEDKEGRIGSKVQIMKEKKEINNHIFKMRKVLFIFERVYYRLLELKSYFDAGYGKGFIKPGLHTSKFFKRFFAQRKDLAHKISIVKYIMKLYDKRSAGALSVSDF